MIISAIPPKRIYRNYIKMTEILFYVFSFAFEYDKSSHGLVHASIGGGLDWPKNRIQFEISFVAIVESILFIMCMNKLEFLSVSV